jgi:hypothetical protein
MSHTESGTQFSPCVQILATPLLSIGSLEYNVSIEGIEV